MLVFWNVEGADAAIAARNTARARVGCGRSRHLKQWNAVRKAVCQWRHELDRTR